MLIIPSLLAGNVEVWRRLAFFGMIVAKLSASLADEASDALGLSFGSINTWRLPVHFCAIAVDALPSFSATMLDALVL